MTYEKIIPINLVNFLDVMRELQRREWVSLDLTPPEPCQVIPLPDGSDDIMERLWKKFAESKFGNQRFRNDSIFCYYLDVNHEGLDADDTKLAELCTEILGKDVTHDKVYFKVQW